MEAPTPLPAPTGRVLFADDFRAGLITEGADAPWQVRALGGRAAGDGTVTSGPDGIVVVPTGTDPETGHPCFLRAAGPGPHLRWAALTSQASSRGLPGFDAVPDGLVVGATIAARFYGLHRHPGPDHAGPPPERDVRAGAAALITLDRATGLVFDVMLTQEAVVAVYERLPRPGDDTAVFSYAVPVAERRADQAHDVAIAYDPVDGRVAWHVDGERVLVADDLGRRSLDRRYLVSDDGGADREAAPAQLVAGLGLMTHEPFGQGVRLAVRRLTVWRGGADPHRPPERNDTLRP